MLSAIRTGGGAPRTMVVALFACVLLMRVLIPQGWMPAAGSFGIMICPGVEAPVTAPEHAGAAMHGMHHNGSGGQEDGGHDHPCAFTLFGLAIAEPSLPSLDLPEPVAPALPAILLQAVAIGRGLAAPPPPSTGPPALS